MKIKLISAEQYNLLLKISVENPILVFNNVGYEYIDKKKFTDSDTEAFNQVTEILKEHVTGFYRFNNFQINKEGKLRLRFQYNWGAADNTMSFEGVGYILAEELHKGFPPVTHEDISNHKK